MNELNGQVSYLNISHNNPEYFPKPQMADFQIGRKESGVGGGEHSVEVVIWFVLTMTRFNIDGQPQLKANGS